jgi:uroporphyrinogen-III synthase
MSKSVILLKNETVPRDPYREAFSENGIETHFVPLLTHKPINHSQIVNFLTSNTFLDEYKAFIITSQRCIESLDSVLSQIEEEELKGSILKKPAYTVGPATYEVLSKLGFEDIRGGTDAGNGSILSEIIISDDLFQGENKKILFLTGETRKDIIPRKLSSSGFDLTELVAYRTEVIPDVVERYTELHKEISKSSSEKWLVFFSPQGTEFITEHLCENLDYKIASIGPTTEDYLLDKGIKPTFVARKPTAASLLEGIIGE